MKVVFPDAIDEFKLPLSKEEYNESVTQERPTSPMRVAYILREVEEQILTLKSLLATVESAVKDTTAALESLDESAITQAGKNLEKVGKKLNVIANPVFQTVRVDNGQEGGTIEPIGDATTGVSVKGMLEVQPSPENFNHHILKLVKAGGEHTDLRLQTFSGSYILDIPANVDGVFIVIDSNGYLIPADVNVFGSLGVGTNTPEERLDVNGNVRAEGYVVGSLTGFTGTITFKDGTGSTHNVSSQGGILTGWTVS